MQSTSGRLPGPAPLLLGGHRCRGGNGNGGGTGDTHDTSETSQLRSVLQERCSAAFKQLAATGEPLDTAALQRWLVARRSVEAAAAALAQHAAWREGFVGANGVDAARIASELAAQKVFMQGINSQGCPVVLFKASRHVAGATGADADAAMLLMCYALDTAIAHADVLHNPLCRVVCVFDLSGLATRNLDVRFLLQLFDLLQAHYPERLAKLFFGECASCHNSALPAYYSCQFDSSQAANHQVK